MSANTELTNQNRLSFVAFRLFSQMRPALVASKFRAFTDKLIPLGYEDESGFHYGPEIAPSRDEWSI